MIYTNANRDDGFGGQFQNIIWDMLYVKETLHQEFGVTVPQKMEHNYENNPDFIESLIKFTNLEKYVPLLPPDYPDKHVISNTEVYPAIESNINFYHESKTMNEYRDIFYRDKVSPYDSSVLNIAVHVRRNNKGDHYPVATPIEKHIDQIKKLRKIFKDKNYIIHIYSQGEENRTIFQGDDIIFHLDEPIQRTFLGFVFADVLCIDASSFSYVAGLITRKPVYYFPLVHRTPFSWVCMED